MHRVYFLTSAQHIESIIRQLQAAGIEEDQIHLIAKDKDLAQRCGVAEATLDETTDVDNASTRGAVAGAATGALAGLAVAVIPGGLLIGGGAIALTTAMGAGLGLSVGTIIGTAEEHPIKAEYEKAIEAGRILVAVDTPADADDKVRSAVHAVDPSIELKERTLTSVEPPAD